MIFEFPFNEGKCSFDVLAESFVLICCSGLAFNVFDYVIFFSA